jgi:cytochrome c biogenesis factor
MTTGLAEGKTMTIGVAAATNSVRPKRPTGEAAAALLAAAIGMLTLALVNQLTAMSDPFNAWVHSVGKLWMPGAQGIGPYSGKETLSLVAWLVSWAILHPVLRTRELPLSRCLVVFLVMVAVATTFIWPPVFEHFAGH